MQFCVSVVTWFLSERLSFSIIMVCWYCAYFIECLRKCKFSFDLSHVRYFLLQWSVNILEKQLFKTLKKIKKYIFIKEIVNFMFPRLGICFSLSTLDKRFSTFPEPLIFYIFHSKALGTTLLKTFRGKCKWNIFLTFLMSSRFSSSVTVVEMVDLLPAAAYCACWYKLLIYSWSSG